jgi:hypothetical protein
MPSPFPGMDPYLEHPAIFPGLHDSFITYIREALQPKLPEPYYAEISDRLWVEVSDRTIEPDVNVLRQQEEPSEPPDSGGVAVATPVATRSEPVVIVVPHDEFREPYVDIMARIEGQERIVTTIEVLSLTNKTAGQHGRELYLRKQGEVLYADVHLVEIDLIRRGPHILDVPLDVVDALRPWDYLVNLTRRGSDEYEVYPNRLRNRLPRIRIPLKAGDEDAVLDLQEVVDRAYDIGPYPERIDYTSDPSPRLSADDAAWADQILKEKGLRQ